MESLEEFARFIYRTKRNSLAIIPERAHVQVIIERLMTLLFGQGCSSNEFMVTSCLTTVKMELIPLIKVCCNTGDAEAESMSDAFFDSLIPVYNLLLKD